MLFKLVSLYGCILLPHFIFTFSRSLIWYPFMSLFICRIKKKKKCTHQGLLDRGVGRSDNAAWASALSWLKMQSPICLKSGQIIPQLLQWSVVSVQAHLNKLSWHFYLFWKLKNVQDEVCDWLIFHSFWNQKTTSTLEFFL